MRICVYCESWFVDEIHVHVVVALLQTDTASVLLEAIGYIRFLQGQIEVMMLINFFLILFFLYYFCKSEHAVKDSFIHMPFLIIKNNKLQLSSKLQNLFSSNACRHSAPLI